jgi:hypothetical protein
LGRALVCVKPEKWLQKEINKDKKDLMISSEYIEINQH